MTATEILLIEDDAVLAPLIHNFLEDNHYKVTWADDGTKGLAAFTSDRPDLVILDLMLSSLLYFFLIRRTIFFDFGSFQSLFFDPSPQQAGSCIEIL